MCQYKYSIIAVNVYNTGCTNIYSACCTNAYKPNVVGLQYWLIITIVGEQKVNAIGPNLRR